MMTIRSNLSEKFTQPTISICIDILDNNCMGDWKRIPSLLYLNDALKLEIRECLTQILNLKVNKIV